MKKDRIYTEANLTQIFRYFSGGTALIFAILRLLPAPFGPADAVSRHSMFLFSLTYGLIFFYLTIPRLEQHLKKWFLPPVLVAASLIPIAIINTKYRALTQAGIPINTLDDTMTVTILLIFPLITTAWNYSYPIVFLFYVVLGCLDPLLILLVNERITPEIFGAFNASLIRIIALGAVGFMITELRHHQKQEHQKLEEANQKLKEYARASEQLAASRERNRIARDMHDTLAHTLSGLSIQLEAIDTVVDSGNPQLKHMIVTAQDTVRAGLHETRRTLKALRARPLEEQGFIPALSALIHNAAGRGGMETVTELPEVFHDYDDGMEEALYRIVQEALENIIRHAGASRVQITMQCSHNGIKLRIQDNGQGFDTSGLPKEGCYGIQGMRERAAAMGGSLQIISRPQRGTELFFEWSNDSDSGNDM